MLETVITALSDEFELNKKHKHGKLILTTCVCIFMFLAGLPQCTRVGIPCILDRSVFDSYDLSLNLFISDLTNKGGTLFNSIFLSIVTDQYNRPVINRTFILLYQY